MISIFKRRPPEPTPEPPAHVAILPLFREYSDWGPVNPPRLTVAEALDRKQAREARHKLELLQRDLDREMLNRLNGLRHWGTVAKKGPAQAEPSV